MKVVVARRLSSLRAMVAENGWQWAMAYLGARAIPPLAEPLDRHLRRLERRGNRPGAQSRWRNYEMWQHWNWTTAGEEWTPSQGWKDSLIQEVLLPNIARSGVVLEIGPGAGRWTEVLQKVATHLIVVDLSDRCIELCRQRFGSVTNMEYHVNDGRSLPFVGPSTVDGIWSFDVFVHIAPDDIRAYLDEMARVLKPAGRAVVHHANTIRLTKGWRSRMTAEEFRRLAEGAGLVVREQFDSWAGGRFRVPEAEDIVTVLERPVTPSDNSAP